MMLVQCIWLCIFVSMCVSVLSATVVILLVSDAGYSDNKANPMIAATPKPVTPKLHSSKLITSATSVRVHRYVRFVILFSQDIRMRMNGVIAAVMSQVEVGIYSCFEKESVLWYFEENYKFMASQSESASAQACVCMDGQPQNTMPSVE